VPESLADRSRAAFRDDGPLASGIPGFAPRPPQVRLSAAIGAAIDAGEALVAEAGTGTGKTYAYLVPALLSGLKVIVSTGTRALQDQLFHRDLPRVRAALGAPIRSALLKGRANYLCLHRRDLARGEFGHHPTLARDFQQVLAWSGRTRSGDIAELEQLPEDSPLWPVITSTAENCLGTECPQWQECFVVKARQEAQAADVVVVNHHLLLADLAIKQEGFGEVLPGAQAFVLDEAHQLPELAAQFFGESVGARQLVELARDAVRECQGTPGALAGVQGPARVLEAAVRQVRAAFEGLPGRGTRLRALAMPEAPLALDALEDALIDLVRALEPLGDAEPGLQACLERAEQARARLADWLAPDPAPRDLDGDDHLLPGAEAEAEAAGDADARGDDARGEDVRWYELSARGFTLQRTPLDVSKPLRQYRERSRAAWIFTSATLAVAGQFQHLARKLGLWEPRTLLEPSPFDWARQALAYLPPGLPEPNARDYGARMLEAVRPVLHASGGRAFLLFTSHRALREAADALAGGPWPLFVQGSAPRHRLLEDFRASGNGVLLGAASFWEGVDVAGDALSVVVIDRLPFAAPDDPVLEARLEACRRRGGNPFRDEQLPQAVIALKQGAGRLIRTHGDRGVLVLCDPRLVGKPYGRLFLDSLPPLPRTRALADVEAFFAAAPASAAQHKDPA
jgi:ATP-dependent DNA helicase DinG